VLCVHRLDAHTDTVSTVAATSNLAATGGWDNTIHLWRWPQLIADAALGDLSSHMSAKKQATEAADEPSAAAASAGSVAVVTDSAAALQGHAQVHFHLRYCS
jgi:WD40 repeat protein